MISGNSRKYGLLFTFALILVETVRSFGQCSAVINTFPYRESFETGTANWTSIGANSDWTWGSPSKPLINSAGDGANCWIIGGTTTSFYNFGERSWVQSPCFDLSAISKPYISFLIFWDTEYRYDGANVQYSIDGGMTWYTIGYANEPTDCNVQNWYNNSGVTNLNGVANTTAGWSGNMQSTSGSCQGGHGSGTWVKASHCVPQTANQSQVMFRFAFGSGTTCNDYDGFAFDDFYIGTAPATPIDFTFTCSGNSEISFTTAGANCLNTYNWNFGDPSSPSNTSSSQSESHTFSTFGSFNVTLTAGGNCSSDTFVTKQVRVVEATVSSTDVTCQGDSDGSVTVILRGDGPSTSISWNTAPVQNTSSIRNLPVGEYTAVISDPVACGLSVSTTVKEGPDARPSVEIGSDLTICPGTIVPLTVSDFYTYQWQDGSTDSTFLITQSGKIILNVTNRSGCTTSDSLLVVEDCLNDILFPNAFTPNADGINEVFEGVGSDPENFTLRIFDRWGELIFESNSKLQGWDGRYNGHFAHDGVYVYQAIYTVTNNTKIEKTGKVVLIR